MYCESNRNDIVRNVLENFYGLQPTFMNNKTLLAENESMICMVDYKDLVNGWVLKITPSATFKGWENTIPAIEMQFRKMDELRDWLTYSREQVLTEVLNVLSRETKELENELESENYKAFR